MPSIEELIGSTIKVQGKVGKIIYPKATKVEAGEFAIFSLNVEQLQEGDIPYEIGGNHASNLIMKGNVPEIKQNSEISFSVVGKLVNNEKYGPQYEIYTMNSVFKLENKEDQIKFFSYILTQNQIEALYSVSEDPIKELLEPENIPKLCTVRGIKERTARKLIEKYKSSKDMSRAYSQLYNYGLTKNLIENLVKRYGSADTAVEKIERNPYLLIYEVKGVGWGKADAMALSVGISPNDPQRIKAFITYFFREQVELNGHTWLDLDVLVNNVRIIAPTVSDDTIRQCLKEGLDEDKFYYDRESNRIGLKENLDLEKEICKHIMRLYHAPSTHYENMDEIIDQCRKETGYDYTEEQVRAIKGCLNNNVSIITALAGCVDCDTEFFTGTEWKKISEYKKGDLVTTINPHTGLTTVEEPLCFIKKPCERFYHIHSDKLDQVFSDDHICTIYHGKEGASFSAMSELMFWGADKYEEITCEEMVQRIRNSKQPIGQTAILSPFLEYVNYPDASGIEEIKSKDGFKYCFTVRSSYFIIRKNNHISVIHNCGKTSIMYPVTRIITAMGNSVAQCALSGKASLNLSQVTHIPGQTIHRLLGIKGDEEEGYSSHGKAQSLEYDVVILDEVSMVGGEIFLDLVRAMKDGSKLIMLGDPGQLEAIGLCNLLKDFGNSGVIPHFQLNKIFRQSAKSGIIVDSVDIYNKRNIIPNDFTGTTVHGELKDFKIVTCDNTSQCAVKAIEQFKEWYIKDKIPLEDIIITVAKRANGEASARALNQYIQDLISPNLGVGETDEVATHRYLDGKTVYDVTYHVGDRVLVTKNCYDTEDEETGDPTPVYNGNLGTVKWISNKEMCVSFLQGDVVFDIKKWENLQLGYAITTHKSQGSGFPYVIYICDPSAYVLLSKEHLYTGITRAKKFCTLIGTASIINKATQTTRVSKKQTWLSELLIKAENEYQAQLAEEASE